MRLYLSLCFILYNSLVDSGVVKNELFKLDIIHYNDFHARFVETSIPYPVCTSNDTSCLGGFARLYQEIMILLEEKPGALLLNAGDTFQGTYWYSLLKWNITQKFINLLPNDAHVSVLKFVETSIPYPVCTSNDTSCLGGFARLYQEIMILLEEKPGALLLNAGDTFQGTYWYSLLKWNITQKFINLLPNDAHAVGNHEFDDGVAGLVPYLAALRAPVVIANIDTSLEPSLNGLYKPHIVIEKNGRNIGIIGLITTETQTSSNPGKVKFLEPISIVEKEAQRLTDQGVDIIIVLSHCGLAIDKQIASTVGQNIDVIVGGHSHSLLWNGKPPSNEYVSGPYPVLIEPESKPDHKVLIVTAECFTKYIGNLTVYFDDKGDLRDFDGVPIFLNRSIPENPEIKALLQPYAKKLNKLVNEVVGFLKTDFLAKKCGSKECEIGNFLADAFLDATKEKNVSNLTHVAFILRNMIRGSIPRGDITRGEIINVLPFTNKVVTFSLPGKYLVEAFRICMTNYWVFKPFQGPWMPQVSGMRVTLNLTNDLIINVLIKEGDEFVPLDPEKLYQVSTLGFLTKGENEFNILKKYGLNETLIGKDTDVLEKYVRKRTPITPVLDERLTVIN